MARRMLTAGTGRALFAEHGDDLYEATSVAVHALLRVEALPVIWEPAWGAGSIVKTLRGAGYRVYPFANRLPMMHRDGRDGPKAHSAMAFAWFLWEAGHRGNAALKRITWESAP
jgi:hypothetical protein